MKEDEDASLFSSESVRKEPNFVPGKGELVAVFGDNSNYVPGKGERVAVFGDKGFQRAKELPGEREPLAMTKR
jgi:hypothetical protein